MFHRIIILSLFICKMLFNELALPLLNHQKGYDSIMPPVKKDLLSKTK